MKPHNYEETRTTFLLYYLRFKRPDTKVMFLRFVRIKVLKPHKCAVIKSRHQIKEDYYLAFPIYI